MDKQPIILLLDDEEVFLEIAAMKLQTRGFQTTAAKNVREALAKAETIRPDLVLSDIYMPPGPSGWDFALQLRRNPRTHDIKLAFFTSLREPWLDIPPGRRQEVKAELGNVIFLSKTDDLETLAERVSHLVQES